MLLPQSSRVGTTITDLSSQWCTYQHEAFGPLTPSGETIYISWCKLSEVYTLAHARRNSEWIKHHRSDTTLIVHIVALGDESECRYEANRLMRSMTPWPVCNLKGVDTTLTSRRLGCSNGETYESQSDAATRLGVNQGMISKHLKGDLTHVKGLKFWRL